MPSTPASPSNPPGGDDRAAARPVRVARARRVWLPIGCIAIAAGLAASAALWITRSSMHENGRELAPIAGTPHDTRTLRAADVPPVAAAPRAAPADAIERNANPPAPARDANSPAAARAQRLANEQRARFRAVSDALLQLDPSLAPSHPPELDASGFSARVWTIPDPVESGAAYRIGIEASWACTALLFAVSEASGEIALLFPNPYQPNSRLEPDRSIELPSTPEWSLRAEGGGIDVLKLVLLAEPIAFPSDRSRIWLASADRPDRIAELEALLAAIEPGGGAAAKTPLRIVARAARD